MSWGLLSDAACYAKCIIANIVRSSAACQDCPRPMSPRWRSPRAAPWLGTAWDAWDARPGRPFRRTVRRARRNVAEGLPRPPDGPARCLTGSSARVRQAIGGPRSRSWRARVGWRTAASWRARRSDPARLRGRRGSPDRLRCARTDGGGTERLTQKRHDTQTVRALLLADEFEIARPPALGERLGLVTRARPARPGPPPILGVVRRPA